MSINETFERTLNYVTAHISKSSGMEIHYWKYCFIYMLHNGDDF